MLAFSRRQKLEPRAVDLNETVRSMRDLLQSTIGGSVHILEPELADGLWPAMIDPTQIELVILNLAINARDAMEVGGTLKIGTANVDHGPRRAAARGAARRRARHGLGLRQWLGHDRGGPGPAFEPFFTTKAVGKGSGLGLSQVFGLAKQSGGGVTIDTEVGEGTTINVYLPRAHAAPRPTPSSSRRPAPMAPADDIVVLIVDDDEAVREVTAGIVSATSAMSSSRPAAAARRWSCSTAPGHPGRASTSPCRA
jgi:signal transduction histidine kinase